MSTTPRKNRSFMKFEAYSSAPPYAVFLIVCLAVMSLASGCKTSGSAQSIQPADPNERVEYVKARSLNLRGGPSTKAPVLGVLKKGERVVIEDRKGNWIKIRKENDNSEGWVYGAYLTGFSIAAPAKPKPAEEQISTKRTTPVEPKPAEEEISTKVTTPVTPKPAEEEISTKETTPVTPKPAEEQISTKETTPVDDASEEEDTTEIGGKITTIAEEEPAPERPSEQQADELESLSPKQTQIME